MLIFLSVTQNQPVSSGKLRQLWTSVSSSLPVRWIFGEDIFISYARRDSLSYAIALARRLSAARFTCHIDAWDTIASQEIPLRTIIALLRSTMLVVIASPAAATSRSVASELRLFSLTRRQIVVISVDHAEQLASWSHLVAGLPLANESSQNLSRAVIAESTLRRVLDSCSFLSRNQRIRRSFAVTMSAIVLGLIAFVWTAKILNKR